jgi:sulfoxide reductase heme-binding subunit YedZ
MVIGAFQLAFGSESPAWRLSMATAYGSLALLGLSLAIGPLKILRGHPNPVSGALRRDIGIWAGALGLLHVFAGLHVHFIGRMGLYFLRETKGHLPFPLRLDAFGVANHMGLLAAVLLIPLLATSNNASLKWLGPLRWKGLQRFTYAVALLVVAHAVIYMALEGRSPMFVAIAALIVLVTATLQALGYATVRNGAGA